MQPQDYTRMVEELEKFLAAVEDTGFCFKELIEKSNAEKRRNRDLNELKQDRVGLCDLFWTKFSIFVF